MSEGTGVLLLFSQIAVLSPVTGSMGGFQGVVVVLYLDLGVDCVGMRCTL